MSSNGILLRPATINDLATLKYWDEQPHVIQSDPNDDWNWEIELNRLHEWREQLVAELGGRPIGFIQIIDPALEDTHYWGNVAPNLRAIDIWIGQSSDLGKGYGTVMMQLALEKCFENPLASNTAAIRFYERLGFRFVEQRTFGDDDCKVYSISRADWQKRQK